MLTKMTRFRLFEVFGVGFFYVGLAADTMYKTET